MPPLHRRDFQLLSEKRLAEAESLFRARLYEGSYHLAGLAVECAVKACIAKQTTRFEFPDKNRVNKSYDHNVGDLVKVAGLQTVLDREIDKNKAFATNWTIVRGWQVESRYTLGIKRTAASALLLSITNPTEGIMPWLRFHW